MAKIKQTYDELSAERKALQAKGEVPDWYTTQGYSLFKENYAYKGETVKSRFQTIAHTLAQYTNDPGLYEHIFFQLMWTGRLAPSTPVLANIGTPRGFAVSCAGGYIGDSISDFYQSYGEIAILSKLGFGTASYLGDIRHRGAKINSTGAAADGAVPVMDSCIDVTTKVSQGGTRRGAWAGYIEFSSPDFNEFLGYTEKNRAVANLGVNYRDSDIGALKRGEKWAVDRFSDHLMLRAKTGKGYFWKPDHANRNAPQAIKQSGISIKNSQLCVSGDTYLLTDRGYHPIKELAGAIHNVWNGERFSPSMVAKTGENQKLIRIETSAGTVIECTPYHKFYLSKGKNPVEAKDLVVGSKLVKNLSLPVLSGDKVLPNAYISGFYSGDGCFTENKHKVYLYGEKKALLPLFGEVSGFSERPEQDRVSFYVDNVLDKYTVPGVEYTVQSRLDWLAGIVDSDGTKVTTGKSYSLQIATIHRSFAEEIKRLLHCLGVDARISLPKSSEPAIKSIKGEEYVCQPVYRVLISGYYVQKLVELGYSGHRVDVSGAMSSNGNRTHYPTVTSITEVVGTHDTYCFNEPLLHKGVLNGQITGNCTEISLPCDKDHTFTCILSSMNLAMWDVISDRDIFNSLVFLDCVCSLFLEQAKASGFKELEKAIRFTEKARALGLGTLGFHTYLQEKRIPFESMEAHFLNGLIFSRLRRNAEEASAYLAKVHGEPEWCKGTGRRNATLITIAPNMSSALLCGSVSQGVEPIATNAFIQPTAGGEFVRYNPTLLKVMREKGMDAIPILKDLAKNHGGSVQHVDWLTDEEKSVFKTWNEIDQMAIIRLASARQVNIDQAQSINLLFSSEESEEYVAEVHKAFLLDDRLLSLYYMRSTRGSVASKGCVACEG